jgi:hypothetical protein
LHHKEWTADQLAQGLELNREDEAELHWR